MQGLFPFSNVPTPLCFPKFTVAPSILIPTNYSIKSLQLTRLKASAIEATIPGALVTFIVSLLRHLLKYKT